MPLRSLLALAALAAACALPAASTAGTRPSTRAVCGYSGYSYAGFQSPVTAYGVSGRLTALTPAGVGSGHVAAWIGVGGAGMGPNGSDVWLQIGIAGYPNGRSELYYEYATPGMTDATYVSLGWASPGVAHDVSVQERATQPGAWRVWLDGQSVSPAIVLPGSHGAWRPIATAETWDGGIRGCNRYGYDFSSLAIATKLAGGWQAFPLTRMIQDPGFSVSARASGFAASTLP
jgi:hypothetical protein